MLSRRLFLKYFSLGTVSIRDSHKYLELFNPLGFGVNSLIDFDFEFNRSNDLLRLHFYFINAEKKGKRYVAPRSKGSPSYMIVRLPQMHISEHTLTDCQFWKIADFDENNTPFGPTFYDNNETVRSYLSSFSFLVFKMDFQGENKILLTEDFLLNWDPHTLLRTEDIGDPKSMPFLIKEEKIDSSYPISVPDKIRQFVTIDGIPVSFFEMPYKMFLSPTAPTGKLGFKFPGNNHTPIEQSFPVVTSDHRKITLRITELYSNDMFLYDPMNAETPYSSPPLRILGYANELNNESQSEQHSTNYYQCNGAGTLPAGVKTYGLLPYGSDVSDGLPRPGGNHRLNLAKLSNLTDSNDLQTRNLTTTKFLLTSWGGYTNLCYYNLESKGYEIVSFKDKIVLGRDERVEVVTMGKDHFGIKCFYIQISQATLVTGKHFMNYYVIIKYPKDAVINYAFDYSRNSLLDDTVEHKCRYIPFTQIRPKTFSTPKLDPLRHIIPINTDTCPKPDYPFNGFFAGFAIWYNNKPLDLEYEGLDYNGNIIARITKPLIFVDDEAWKPAHSASLKDLNSKINSGADILLKNGDHVHLTDYRIAKVYRVKLAYALLPITTPPPFIATKVKSFSSRTYDQQGSTAAKRKENELETEKIDFYIDISATGTTTDFPCLPTLREASVYLPQVNGLLHEDVQVGVNYAKSYIDNAFDFAGNKAKVFANLTDGGMKMIADKLRDVQNMKMLGGFVTPDIPIAAISILSQSVTLYENVNKVINEGDKISQISPSEILRGKFPEVFKGIDLLKVLNDYLPLENTPVFEVVQKFDETAAAADEFFSTIGQELKTDKDRIQGDIAKYQQQLTGYQSQYDTLSRSISSKLIERFQVVNNDLAYAQRVVGSLNASVADILKQERDFADKELAGFGQDISAQIQSLPG